MPRSSPLRRGTVTLGSRSYHPRGSWVDPSRLLFGLLYSTSVGGSVAASRRRRAIERRRRLPGSAAHREEHAVERRREEVRLVTRLRMTMRPRAAWLFAAAAATAALLPGCGTQRTSG